MKKIHAWINGQEVEVPYNYTILEAAEGLGIHIPTLCHLKHVAGDGSCRICMVESEGRLVAACSTRIMEGDVIWTESPRVVTSRRGVLDLLLSYHTRDCLNCPRNEDCRLQEYCDYYRVGFSTFDNLEPQLPVNTFNSCFTYDANKCILCRRCVNVCHKLVGKGAIDPLQSGVKSLVSAVFNMDWADPYCENCGNCVSVCPVAALVSKKRVPYQKAKAKRVRTTCSQCGLGCQMDMVLVEDQIVDLMPVQDLTGHGLLCAKGKFGPALEEGDGLLMAPLLKDPEGELKECSWNQAMEALLAQIASVKAESGGEAIAGLASTAMVNEALFLFQKFMRLVAGTNNIDHVRSIGGNQAEKGFEAALGFVGMSNPSADLKKTDLILVICREGAVCPPLLDMQIRQAVRMGRKLIVVDPKGQELEDVAHVFLPLKPGTFTALANAMIWVIFHQGLTAADHIRKYTEGLDELRGAVDHYSLDQVSEICGLDEDMIRQAALAYATAARAQIIFCEQDAWSAMAACNLAMITGHMGSRGQGITYLSGSGNQRGARDMGVMPDRMPGNDSIDDFSSLVRAMTVWRTSLNEDKGYGLDQLADRIVTGQVKLLYLVGDGEFCQDHRGGVDLVPALEQARPRPFLVVQSGKRTRLTQLADLVLPANVFSESEGSLTSMERKLCRVRGGTRKASGRRPHWRIFADLLRLAGFRDDYGDVWSVWDEIKELVPDYAGIPVESLMRGEEDLFTPWKKGDTKGKGVLFTRGYGRKNGLGLLSVFDWTAGFAQEKADYPILIMTCPIHYHYCKTDRGPGSIGSNPVNRIRRNSPGPGMVKSHPANRIRRNERDREGSEAEWLELNEETGKRLFLKDWDLVKIIYPGGSFVSRAHLVDTLPADSAWILSVPERLTGFWEPEERICLIPGFHQARVRIEKL